MNGFSQFGCFFEGSNRKEGRSFEKFMLGDPPVGHRVLTGVEKQYIRELSPFEKALTVSTIIQPPGFPWGSSGHEIDRVLEKVRGNFPKEERPNIYVFNTLGTRMDSNTVGGCQYHTDCFFFWRGSIVTVDVTLRLKETANPCHVVLSDSLLGDEGVRTNFCAKVAEFLKRGMRTISPQAFFVINYRIRNIYAGRPVLNLRV